MKVPTFDQVFAWCEEHDGHATEGWLTSLLDGSISLVEMRAAILEGRAINMPPDDRAALADELAKLPEHKGWFFGIERNGWDWPPMSRAESSDRFVWRHPDLDERIYCTPNCDRHEVDIEVYPPDAGGISDGSRVDFPVRTAEALFAIVKPWLDEYGHDDEAGETDETDET